MLWLSDTGVCTTVRDSTTGVCKVWAEECAEKQIHNLHWRGPAGHQVGRSSVSSQRWKESGLLWYNTHQHVWLDTHPSLKAICAAGRNDREWGQKTNMCVCVQVCLHVSLCTCVVGWERLDLGVGLDEVSLMALHPSEHPSVKQSGRRTSVSQCERKYPTQTHTHTHTCVHTHRPQSRGEDWNGRCVE